MPDRAPTVADSPDSPGAQIESFLVRKVRAKPGLGFSAIVDAAQVTCHVSRATAARHLSRLVRFGDVTLLPDRTYVIGESATPGPRPTLELRWVESRTFIRADGTAWSSVDQEYRVASGTLHHFDFFRPKPHRHILWWSTAPSHVSRIPAGPGHGLQGTHRVEFDPPLSSRNATWQRMHLAEEFPRRYRMMQGPLGASAESTAPGEGAQEADNLEVHSQRSNFAQRFSSDARLRLQVVLPTGYPIGAAESRIAFPTRPDRMDPAEQLRVDTLSQASRHFEGLRRSGSTLTLSVPRPRLDRRYEIRWTLPTAAGRDRWLADDQSPELRRAPPLRSRTGERSPVRRHGVRSGTG
ncbi:MAG: hypothetical protein L3K03_04135 [Thermoplasmata archaeon]|nr:hypothetical protein [Thermoplasmata archaeon]